MTTQQQSSIFDKSVSPVLQAAIALGGVIVVSIGAKVVKMTGLIPVADHFPWISAAAFLLVFALFNSIFSLASDNMMKYWGKSIYSFLGLAVVSGLFAYLFSSLSIDEAGSYRWIFIVLTIGYFVFLGMMAFMRTIVEFAEREEWNQPRIRRKTRKK